MLGNCCKILTWKIKKKLFRFQNPIQKVAKNLQFRKIFRHSYIHYYSSRLHRFLPSLKNNPHGHEADAQTIKKWSLSTFVENFSKNFTCAIQKCKRLRLSKHKNNFAIFAFTGYTSTRFSQLEKQFSNA